MNSVNDTVLDILWEAPATPNGGILHYYVSIINLADGSTVREETREGKSFTQKNLGILNMRIIVHPFYY